MDAIDFYENFVPLTNHDLAERVFITRDHYLESSINSLAAPSTNSFLELRNSGRYRVLCQSYTGLVAVSKRQNKEYCSQPKVEGVIK